MHYTPTCLLHALADHPAETPHDVLLALASALRDGLMRELLVEVRTISGNVSALAQLSYRHELGFTKVTLGEFPDRQLKVRLHVWQQAKMPDEANIHNHRFDGYSYVLRGAIGDTRWEASASSGGTHLHYRYTPRLDASEYVLKYLGRACLTPTMASQAYEGDTYWFSGEDLHTTTVLSRSLLTLFLEDRKRLRSYADVFSRRYPANHHPITATALSEEEYIKLLRDAASQLSL